MKVKDLAGSWELSPVDTFPSSPDDVPFWLTMDVPSHWQQHPDLETHAGKVVYKKHFSIRKKKTAAYRLVLPGVFYWSTVYLNGRRLGDHEGYFAAQVYDVTADLKSKNDLVVHVDCPNEKKKNGKRMITGVFGHWDCLDPQTNPGGIWLAPYLQESTGLFVDALRIHTESIGNDRATLRARIDLSCDREQPAVIRVEYKPATFKGNAQVFKHEADLAAGANALDFSHTLTKPRLWWTHDLGRPDLYDATVQVLDAKGKIQDEHTQTVGVRTVTVRDWIFTLNGQRLYIKGNNYAPADTRLATVTDERVEQDLQLARDCHMNMLRVHAHVDHPALYRAADRAGMLLWQDFPLQWSYQKDVLPVARDQMARMVRLLYNHPSVALWCCHNEAIHLVDTKDEDFVNLAKSAFSIFIWSWNRNVMDVQLKKVAQNEDPSRFVNRSSGEPGLIKESGDTHFYFGWYRVQGPKRLFEKVAKLTPKNLRFVTEFGAQSFPNLESSRKFMDEHIDRIDWERLQQRNSLQIDLMEHWVGLDHESLADLITASQEYQSRINQYYIDRIRLLKYAPGGGVIPFMFNDPNPAVQWSVVDYWRVPKKSYEALCRAFSPQYAFALPDKDEYLVGEIITVPVYAVNDARESYGDVTLDYVLTAPDGQIVMERAFRFFLPQDCLAIPVAQVQQALDQKGTYRLVLTMRHAKFTLENDYPIEVA